jgi:hypothetical protein
MMILGIRINNNVLAVIFALGVIAFCLTIAYLFQRNLFGKYRGKVKNAVNKNNSLNTPDKS